MPICRHDRGALLKLSHTINSNVVCVNECFYDIITVVMSNIDVTINITIHNEGEFLYKTYKSISRAVVELKLNHEDVVVQVNAGLDKADSITSKIERKYRHLLSKVVDIYCNYNLEFGDPALARNYLVKKSTGKYIAMFDGDDLISYNYLNDAYEMAVGNNEPSLYSAAFVMNFNRNGCWPWPIFRILGSNDADFLPTSLYEYNPYPNQLFGDAEIFHKYLYKSSADAYKYEDFSWLLSVLADGYAVNVVPETIFFYRQKNNGVNAVIGNDDTRIIAPVKYYQPDYFSSLLHRDSNSISMQSYIFEAKNQYREVTTTVTPQKQHSRAYKFVQLQYGAIRQLLMPLYKFLRYNYVSVFVYPYWRDSIYALLGKEKSEREAAINLPRDDADELFKRSLDNLNKIGFTANCINICRQSNIIEPLIRFDKSYIVNGAIESMIKPSLESDSYFYLCNVLANCAITDVLIMNHIVRGGAEKAMVNLVKALSANGRKVLVVTTDNGVTNTWARLMSNIDGCRLAERQQYFRGLSDNQIERIIANIVQNSDSIKTITVMNSVLGARVIARYHKALRKCVKMIQFSWMYNKLDTGLLDEPYLLSENYHFLDQIVTDGQQYKKELLDENGWLDDKIIPVYQPINDNIKLVTKHAIFHRIIYAGRIARQKRVDLLVQKAPELEKMGVTIDFYGTIDSDDKEWANKFDFVKEISSHSNLRYRGKFDDFAKLPLDDYDALILPTQYEGMPNVILESLKANMPVIVGECGSLPYYVRNYVNGLLVKNNGDANAYLEAIVDFYEKRDKFSSYDERLKYNQKILEKHSVANYEKSIAEIYNIE